MAKNKKRNKNILVFFDEVYMQEFLVIFAPTHKQFCEIVKDRIGFEPDSCEDGNQPSGEFHGLTNKKMGSLAVIWSSDKDEALTHEIFHAVCYTLRNREIHLEDCSSEEAYAYYLTYLRRKIKREMNG